MRGSDHADYGVDIPAYADLPGQSTAYYPFQITQTLPLPDELHTEMRRADVDREFRIFPRGTPSRVTS